MNKLKNYYQNYEDGKIDEQSLGNALREDIGIKLNEKSAKFLKKPVDKSKTFTNFLKVLEFLHRH